jgi:hypothetical protein
MYFAQSSLSEAKTLNCLLQEINRTVLELKYLSKILKRKKERKIILSLQEAVQAHRVVRRRGSHIS